MFVKLRRRSKNLASTAILSWRESITESIGAHLSRRRKRRKRTMRVILSRLHHLIKVTYVLKFCIKRYQRNILKLNLNIFFIIYFWINRWWRGSGCQRSREGFKKNESSEAAKYSLHRKIANQFICFVPSMHSAKMLVCVSTCMWNAIIFRCVLAFL